METTITLQEPFSYSLWPIMILLVILFFSMIIFMAISVNRKNKHKDTNSRRKAKEIIHETPTLEQVKQQYMSALTDLKQQYMDETVSERICYQKLSSMLRQFVSSVSGNDITNMTLTEIRHQGLKQVEQLISEYYEPEFSREAKSDIEGAIERTKKVIEEWN